MRNPCAPCVRVPAVRPDRFHLGASGQLTGARNMGQCPHAPDERSEVTVAALGDKAYVIGDYNGDHGSSDL